jgi:hypothetical protein
LSDAFAISGPQKISQEELHCDTGCRPPTRIRIAAIALNRRKDVISPIQRDLRVNWAFMNHRLFGTEAVGQTPAAQLDRHAPNSMRHHESIRCSNLNRQNGEITHMADRDSVVDNEANAATMSRR